MSEFRLYWRYIRMHFLAELQYKGWPMKVLFTLFIVLTDPLDALLMLDRFGAVGGWSASRIMLIYGMALTGFGLAELFGRGLDYFPMLIRNGEFDRILLRPRSELVQAMTLRFHLNRLARVVGGGALVAVCLAAQGKSYALMDVLMIALALLGGMITYMGLFLIASGVAFFTIQGLDWIYIFSNGSYQLTKVPPKLMPDWIRRVFLYVMPMLPFCYYPASAACGWGEPYALGFVALPASAAFFGLGFLVWKVGIRHYASTGS